MNDFSERFKQYSAEAIKEGFEFVEKSNGLYTNDDMPAFIAGYMAACIRKAQEK